MFVYVAAVVLVALAAAWHFLLDPMRVFSAVEFDASQWRKPPQFSGSKAQCGRGAMAEHLRSKVLHSNMGRADIEGLLGPPSRKSDEEYMYVLGWCSGFRMDLDSLHIYFNKDGRYKSSSILQG